MAVDPVDSSQSGGVVVLAQAKPFGVNTLSFARSKGSGGFQKYAGDAVAVM